MKKYMDIKVLNTKIAGYFEKGDHIVIQEKIDGANFSVRIVENTGKLTGFSRNQELTDNMALRGAYNFVQQLNTELFNRVLGTRYIVFMEWLVPHKVVYPDNCYNKAYAYDVYDIENEVYLKQDKVKEMVEELGLTYVPVFYDGEFDDWKHIESLVGKTALGGEYGEGVVVKNMDKLNDKRGIYYTKIVSDTFREKKKMSSSIPIDKEQLALEAYNKELIASIVTYARINKLVCKMIDDAIIPENYNVADIATIRKTLPREVYKDCVKEEPEIVEKVGKKFGAYCNKIVQEYIKNMFG